MAKPKSWDGIPLKVGMTVYWKAFTLSEYGRRTLGRYVPKCLDGKSVVGERIALIDGDMVITADFNPLLSSSLCTSPRRAPACARATRKAVAA